MCPAHMMPMKSMMSMMVLTVRIANLRPLLLPLGRAPSLPIAPTRREPPHHRVRAPDKR